MTGSRKQKQDDARRRNERRRAAVRRRREAARRHGIQARVAASARRRRRRQILAGSSAGVLLIIVPIIVTVIVIRSRPDAGPSTSMIAELVEGSDGALPITETANAYTVTYQVESYSDDGNEGTVTTVDFTVRRPFDSRIVGKADAPPGTDEQWSVTASLGLYQQTSAEQDPTANVFTPTVAPGDHRLDVSLFDLVADGSFVLGDRRTLLGRECQVYRTGSPLESNTVSAPTDTDYSDVCIDAAGLLLEELSVAGGAVTGHQVATAITVNAELTDDDFVISAPATAAADGGADLDVIDATTDPGTDYWTLAKVPTGYELTNRYALRQSITDPEADTTDTTAVASSVIVESYVDVYVNGVNVIVVQQGPASVDPGLDSTRAHTVETANLGTAQTSTGTTGNVVAATPTSPDDWYVQMSGTVARTELLTIVDQLSIS